jgi:acyl phosphate:glycerol-3-phosphate acyltransferase
VHVGQVVLCVAGYLAGSLPFGYAAGRLAGVDVRRVGSGNTGATNVWRALGPRYGAPVLVLDALKGAVPALVGAHWFGPGTAVLAGGAAVVGHTLPVFLGFGGGKGVATAAGVVLALTPLVAIPVVLLFVAILWLTRYVSLGSLVAAVAYPVVCLVAGEPWQIVLFGTACAAIIVVRHRANIGRLLHGTEHKAKTFGRGAPRRA